MPTYRIAHIAEQGQHIVLIPVDDQFQFKADQDRHAFMTAIQASATAARLAGAVVLVWNGPNGQLAFMGPRPWHSWLQGLTMSRVTKALNKTLTCQA